MSVLIKKVRKKFWVSKKMDYAQTLSQNPAARKTYSLDSLSQSASGMAPPMKQDGMYMHKKKGMNIWLMLLILAIIIGFILYFTHPAIVLSRNASSNELYVDWGKLILWAIGIAIIVVLLLWVLKGVIGYEMTY